MPPLQLFHIILQQILTFVQSKSLQRRLRYLNITVCAAQIMTSAWRIRVFMFINAVYYEFNMQNAHKVMQTLLFNNFYEWSALKINDNNPGTLLLLKIGEFYLFLKDNVRPNPFHQSW